MLVFCVSVSANAQEGIGRGGDDPNNHMPELLKLFPDKTYCELSKMFENEERLKWIFPDLSSKDTTVQILIKDCSLHIPRLP